MSEFIIDREPMVCASAEAESRVYRRVNGERGTIWLIPTQENSADSIHAWKPGPSDGYAGRTLSFTLDDGSVLELTGPWYSNPHALFKATGIDIRDKHLTFGVVALSRKCSKETGQITLVDVLYQDNDWTLGTYSRVKELAQELAQQHEETLIYYSRSKCGSSCGPVSYIPDDPLAELREG